MHVRMYGGRLSEIKLASLEVGKSRRSGIEVRASEIIEKALKTNDFLIFSNISRVCVQCNVCMYVRGSVV